MDFSLVFQKYKGLWVALSSDEKKIVGKGKTLESAVREAKRKGVEVPLLFKVPKKMLSYVSSGDEVQV